LFGLPLSDPQIESIEGKDYTVQWFERARFELHPENAPPYNVLLGLLGTEVHNAAAAPPPPPPPPAAQCADVHDPVNARIRPSKCVKQGEIIAIDIFGFKPNEEIGFWLTAPDGSILGTVRTVNIGPTGEQDDLPFDTKNLPLGQWFFVFEGTSSKHQAIVYFKVLKP